MVVDGDGENALGVELANDVAVENTANLLRRRHAVPGFDEGVLVLLADDVHAEFDAFIADEYGRTSNQFANLMLTLAAERAVQSVLLLSHCVLTFRARPTNTMFLLWPAIHARR
jgi:hypothetical protein